MGRVIAISILVTCLGAGIFGKPLKPEERLMKHIKFNGEDIFVREEAKPDPFSPPEPFEEEETPGAVEADMFLNEEQKEILKELKAAENGRSKRKAVRDLSVRWTKNIVPYVFESTVSSEDMGYIKAGMEHWTEKTCVTFQEYSSSLAASLGHNQRLSFFKGDGCWSWVGRQPTSKMTPQQISIGAGCTGLGTVAHEIGHAMGFQHEQSRPDRDEHVEILWNNIDTDQKHNFDKYSIDAVMSNDVVQYDTKSTMHYGAYGFAIDPSLPTLVTKRAFDMQYIGQREGLSFYDIKLANIIFECTSICTTPIPECANGGFVDKSCTCQCPQEWTGTLCDEASTAPTVVTEITETAASGVIKSTNYDAGQYPTNNALMIYIVGQPESTITVTFEEFDLEPIDGTRCWDYVQVNINDLRYGGNKYCGNTLPSPIVATGDLMIWFYSDESVTKKGFKASYTIDLPLTTEAPTTNAPTQAPTTNAPTEAPTTNAPTEAPTTNAPTEAPTTKAPTEATTTKAPTESPTTNAPTEAPTTNAPTEAPTTNAPTEAPTTNAPTEAPTTNAPTEAPVETTTQEIAVTTAASMKTITSPNYPEVYNVDYTKIYNLQTAVGKQIYLMIDDIDIQTNSAFQCNEDKLIIDNGKVQYRLCGKGGKVGPFVSVSNTMKLTFVTDGSVELKGFQASFLSFESSSCGSTLDGNSGIVTSPNYPSKYANNLDCEYRIVVEQGKRVELTFDKFEIENHPSSVCQFDCVKIEGAANGVLRYDGYSLPGPISSSGNELVITITSDAFENRDGFVARYRAV